MGVEDLTTGDEMYEATPVSVGAEHQPHIQAALRSMGLVPTGGSVARTCP